MNFLLFLTAYILFFPFTLINYLVVFFKSKDSAKGYFYTSAANIDRFANREFRTLWNTFLKIENGYSFGNIEETISSALGKNERDNTLSKCGIAVVWILDKIEKDHCQKSIVDFKKNPNEK